jgi:hypothetical protein
MKSFTDLTLSQLKQAIAIREKIESLEGELSQILGGNIPTTQTAKESGRKKVSAAGRARMAAAQKARWAKLEGKKTDKTSKPKRKMSTAVRAAMSAAAKARWKKAKAAGKSRL